MGVLVLVLPILNYLILSGVGRKLGVRGSLMTSVTNMGVALGATGVAVMDVQEGISMTEVWGWVETGELKGEWGVIVDPLVCALTLAVMTISMCVHIFSLGYIEKDPSITKFFALLGLFTGSMVLMVMSTSLIEFFVG